MALTKKQECILALTAEVQDKLFNGEFDDKSLTIKL